MTGGNRLAALLPIAACAVACTVDRDGRQPRIPGKGSTDAAVSMDASSVPGPDGSQADGSPTDGGPDVAFDAGPPPQNFFEVDWARPEPVVIGGVESPPCDKWFDPVLTPDRAWLVLSRFDSSDCEVRRFHVFEWEDGRATWMGMIDPLVPDGTEHNPHPLAGGYAGRPGELLLYFTTGGGDFGDRSLMASWLSGPVPFDVEEPVALDALDGGEDDSDPTLSQLGDRLIFSREGDLYEATGRPPFGHAEPTKIVDAQDGHKLDPALSPDGRVLVYARTGDSDHADLWVVRRPEPDGELGSPERLPSGADQINTDADEWDAFLAKNGDLLFTRREGDMQRVYMARAILP